MKEKPILFNTEMVRAILEGRKTQTRRVIKPIYNKDYNRFSRMSIFSAIKKFDPWWHGVDYDGGIFVNDPIEQPRYQPGDILWVRETWQLLPSGFIERPPEMKYIYKATHELSDECAKWRPSIHMSREAARIFLRVTDVRAERLRDITISDCIAEGIPKVHGMRSEIINWYNELWDTLNAKRGYGWDTNPWVWVITFEKIEEESPCNESMSKNMGT